MFPVSHPPQTEVLASRSGSSALVLPRNRRSLRQICRGKIGAKISRGYILRTVPDVVYRNGPVAARLGKEDTRYSTDRVADLERTVWQGSQTRSASGLDEPVR